MVLATLLFCNLFIKCIFYLLNMLFKEIKAIKERSLKRMTQFTFVRRSINSSDITESLPTDLDFGFNLEETDT